MKGYYMNYGYMGWMPKEQKYRMFVNETEYKEAYEEA